MAINNSCYNYKGLLCASHHLLLYFHTKCLGLEVSERRKISRSGLGTVLHSFVYAIVVLSKWCGLHRHRVVTTTTRKF